MPNNVQLSPRIAQIFRILVGLLFGLAIAYLIKSFPDKEPHEPEIWRATLTTTLFLLAFVFWAGLGVMRRYSMLIWGVIAAGLIAIIVRHAVGRDGNSEFFDTPNIFWIIPFLFIVHELVSSADFARRPIAPYEIYFDEAWKRGVQLVLSLVFTLVFWLILWTGATLLKIIGLNWFEDLLKNEYFAIPAVGMAMGVAVHLGDVQPKLLNNFRNLVLSMFSWLLPIIVLVGAIFSISLIFTGLKPLWETKAATASLLSACMFLVLLINAAYQNGDGQINGVLKWAIRIGGFEAFIFAAIAAYSLYLRIDQYGLTHERILALIGVIVALLFGLLYALANFIPLKSSEFMPHIKSFNIGMAFVKAIIFFAILTPIADPSRLSVESQVARLNEGKVAIDKFDWHFLRFESGKYGKKALEALKSSPNKAIAAKAIETQKIGDGERYAFEQVNNPENIRKPNLSQVTMAKGSLPIPESFKNQILDFNIGNSLPECLRNEYSEQKCDVSMMDLNNDGQAEIVFLGNWYAHIAYFENGKWNFAQADSQVNDDKTREAFKNGQAKVQKSKWDDIVIGDNRLRVLQKQ